MNGWKGGIRRIFPSKNSQHISTHFELLLSNLPPTTKTIFMKAALLGL